MIFTHENYFHDLLKERSLLGSILTHNDILDNYKIDRDLFYAEGHRLIYDQILTTKTSGVPANVMNVGMAMSSIAGEIAKLTDYLISDIRGCVDSLRACQQSRSIAALIRELAEKQGSLEAPMDIAETAVTKALSISLHRNTNSKTFTQVACETFKAIEMRARKGAGPSGIQSGIEQLDSWTDGFQNGDYIVLGARPSVGKTAFALALSREAVKRGARIGFMSLEMSAKALMMRYLAAHANCSLQALRTGLISPKMQADLYQSLLSCQNDPLFFIDSPSMNITDIVSEARVLKSREKITGLIIDYIGLISTDQKDAPRWEIFSMISQRIKALARELDIPVIALSQLRREAQDKRPNLADLRESGSLEQDADIIMFLNRKDSSPAAKNAESIVLDLLLDKQRNGPTGEISLNFNKARMQFRPFQEEKTYDKDARTPYKD